jgi:hypothetical protein
VKPLGVALFAAAFAVTAPMAANASADGSVKKIKTKMTAAQVFPGPGEAKAKGNFDGKVDGDSLCYRIKVKKTSAVTGAHLHAGAPGSTGEIVVTLAVPTKKWTRECLVAVPDSEDTEATLSESELAAIMADRGAFYVDVHTTMSPDGAVRGQLKS